jgi:hypothetical protein
MTPASRYTSALRLDPDRIEEPWYDADHQVCRVRTDGTIKWRGDHIFLSEALAGEPIGLAELEEGGWCIRFADLPLGRIDAEGKVFRRFAAARDSVNHVPGP